MRRVDSSVCQPGFERLLEGFGHAEVERHEGAVYGLRPDLTLGYLNAAWFRFADENGGSSVREHWGLGASVLDATSGPARELYEEGFQGCLARGQPWRLDYECSSAERHRRFHMDVYPLRAGRGLLVINTLFVDQPHADGRVARQPLAERYTDADGLVLQCSFCRRIQRAGSPGQWDWVPDWVRDAPANVTGGMCRPCFQATFERSARDA